MNHQTIHSLQVFRGLAALAVVVHHAIVSTGAFVGAVPAIAMTALSMGYLGVDFFFVLSGFIIMYVHMDDESSRNAVGRYAYKRFVRIYPAYLPISIALIALYALLPGFSASGGREFSMASSLLLVPADNPPALSVAWTLVHEMMFYSVFLLYFASRKLLFGTLALWGGVILVSHALITPTGWLRYPLSLLNIEFMFGVLSALIVKRSLFHHQPGWLMVAGTVLSMSMLFVMGEEGTSLARLGFAFGLAVLVVGFALLERKTSLPWPSLLVLLGGASYSIYLIHNPLLSVTQRLAGHLDMHWGAALAFGVLLSLFAGLAYYFTVERPALAYFRRRSTRV